MKQVRNNIFETNSSSSHVFTFNKKEELNSYYYNKNLHRFFNSVCDRNGFLSVSFGYYGRPLRVKKLNTYKQKFSYFIQALCDQYNHISSDDIGSLLTTITGNYHHDIFKVLFNSKFMEKVYLLLNKMGYTNCTEYDFVYKRVFPLVVSNKKKYSEYATPYEDDHVDLEVWTVYAEWLTSDENLFSELKKEEIEKIEDHNDERIAFMAKCILDPDCSILIGSDEAFENIAKRKELINKKHSFIESNHSGIHIYQTKDDKLCLTGVGSGEIEIKNALEDLKFRLK